MYRYTIDYTFGRASFYTNTADEKTALREFRQCAHACFGIRKSLHHPRILEVVESELPPAFQGQDITHLLSHSGDVIAFDARYETPDGDAWKVWSEWGDTCTCTERGKPELPCVVHHFYVADHDAVCDCQKRR